MNELKRKERERVLFKINTDKFGFAREPQPDRVSRDYAAELVRKLISEEKSAREANDNILDGYISQEADIRGTEDARIQALIGEINAVLNSHSGSISGLLEQVQAEVQARAAADETLDEKITDETTARDAKDTELQTAINSKADKQTVDGGFAGGEGAYVQDSTGAAVGAGAIAFTGGAVGASAGASQGGAVGAEASADSGGAVGLMAKAMDGGAVGNRAITGDGFAGGSYAQAVNSSGTGIDAIQLGTGINSTPKTLQVYDYQLMDAEGNIPIERMAKEVEARETKDAELQSAINKEISDRKLADSNLYSAVDSWIDNEKSERTAADRELQANIDKKQDKVTISEYPEDNSELIYDLSIMHNQELRTKSTLANGITFLIPNDVYPDDYVTSLSFNTGDTAPQVSYSATGIINWVGTDCSVSDGKSIFAPKANTRYEIVIYYNGVQFIGLVNGFIPATVNNSGQTEATS